MKIQLKTDPQVPKDELHIHCKEITAEIRALVEKLQTQHLVGRGGNGDSVVVELSAVLYFESVEKKVFAYTASQVLETNYRLYELEEKCPPGSFYRISKTTLVNIRQIRLVRPEEGRRLKIQLQNGEWILISRLYAKAFKKQLKEGIK